MIRDSQTWVIVAAMLLGASSLCAQTTQPAPAAGSSMEVGRLVGHYAAVTALAMTPDAKFAISGGADQNVMVWDVATRKCLQVLHGHINKVTSVAITPDGRRAASGGLDFRLCVWDLKTGKLLSMTRHDTHVHSVAISDDGKTAVAASCVGGEITAVDVDADKVLWSNRVADQSYAVAISPDGSVIAAGSTAINENQGHTFAGGGAITLFKRDGTVDFTFDDLGAIQRLRFLADPNKLAWCTHNKWGVADMTTHEITQGQHIQDAAEGSDFSADGSSIFVPTAYEFVRVPLAKKEITYLPRCVEATRAAAVSADGNTVLVAGGGSNHIEKTSFSIGRDTAIRILDLRKDAPPFATTKGASQFAVSPDKKLIAFCDEQFPVILFDVAKGAKIAPQTKKGAPPLVGHQPRFTSDGKQLLLYSRPLRASGAVVVVDPLTYQKQKEWPILHERPLILELSGDDRYCLVARADILDPKRKDSLDPTDKDVQVIDLVAGTRLADLPTGTQPVVSLSISSDSKRAIVSLATPTKFNRPVIEEKRVVQVWEIATAKNVYEFDTPGGCSDVAMTDKLIAAGYGTQVLLWDAKTGQPQPPVEGLPDRVRQLLFYKDNLLVNSGGMLYLIDPKTHDLICEREIVNGTGSSMQLLPDGTLMVGSKMGGVIVNPVSLP